MKNLFDEKLEDMEKEVYEKDDKKKIIKAVLLVLGALIVIIMFFAFKSKIDYTNNSEKLEKYAREYYEENMRSINIASGYTVTLRMLEAVEEYELDYFEDCDDKETKVDILVDDNGDITKTTVKINCDN